MNRKFRDFKAIIPVTIHFKSYAYQHPVLFNILPEFNMDTSGVIGCFLEVNCEINMGPIGQPRSSSLKFYK